MSESRVRFYGAHAKAFLDTAREKDIEGAVRSGKTTLGLEMVLHSCQTYPGINWLLARWTDDGVEKTLKPSWRERCDRSGTSLRWNGNEGYDELDNGSRVYITGLKAQDQTLRYAKFRGKTLSGVYVDQAEEIPERDIYLELCARLSQFRCAGCSVTSPRDCQCPEGPRNLYPHQIIITPQSVEQDHWIADEFPIDNLPPERAYYPLSIHDNAHNLDAEVIPNLLRLYPPGHSQHAPLVLGERGSTVIGDPVYGDAFHRARHEAPCDYDRRLGLEVGLDFGKHHPCVVMRQVAPSGQTRYLGGILGHDLNLDPFLEQVLRYINLWFPEPIETRWCCDPAGVNNPIGIDMGAMLKAHGIIARHVDESNMPNVRLGCIEAMSARMRKRDLAGNEAFLVARNEERWLQISHRSVTIRRMLAEAFQFGYVWDKNMVSVGSKQMRKPKKDGWHEHPMNVVEYLEANFGAAPPRKKAPERGVRAVVSHGEMGYAG
jgi:hypothetical protein